nr:protein-L-isoaspartate(D-aspartate) O-methyltransferase [uncultured Carboxylicivirga sp.]
MHRQEMIQHQIIERGITDHNVINAMSIVPRHHFVPRELQSKAYWDCPLPIGHNQTISQPYMVAYMTEKLNLKASDKVLEIGTGSGYQTAILAQIVSCVYSIEIIKALSIHSYQKLNKEKYTNVYIKHADGYYGWSEKAPFNAIIVTAAANYIPRALIDQLADKGKLIIPVTTTPNKQFLKLFKKENDKILMTKLLSVRFVPFTRE